MTLILTPPTVGLPPIKVVMPAHPGECNHTHFRCSTPTQATGHIQIAQSKFFTEGKDNLNDFSLGCPIVWKKAGLKYKTSKFLQGSSLINKGSCNTWVAGEVAEIRVRIAGFCSWLTFAAVFSLDKSLNLLETHILGKIVTTAPNASQNGKNQWHRADVKVLGNYNVFRMYCQVIVMGSFIICC